MKKALLLIALVATLASCSSSKETAIKNLRSFHTELQEEAPTYRLADWNEAKDKYVKINKKIAKHRGEYTQEESQEIGELNGQCMGIFGKTLVTNATGTFVNAATAIKGLLNGVRDVLGI